jgi:thymidylate synthase ThyX
MVNIKKPTYQIEFILDGMEYLRLIERCGRTSYKSKSKLIDQYEKIKISKTELKPFMEKIQKIIQELYNRCGRNYDKDVYSKFYNGIDKDLEMVKDASALQFVDMIIQNGHTSILEFGWLIVRFFVNIGYTREQNRHRETSIIERSTRYADECDDEKFGGQLQVVSPLWFEGNQDDIRDWKTHMEEAENNYKYWLKVLRDRANKEPDEKKREKMLKEVTQQARGVLPLDTESEECIGGNLREWSEVIFRLRASPYAHPSMQQIMYPLQKELRRKIPIVFDYNTKVIHELVKE